MQSEESRIEFMLSRSLGICLTDPRAIDARRVDTGFALFPFPDGISARVFLFPLLLMLNALRLAPAFRRIVLPAMKSAGSAFARKKESGLRTIDWSTTAKNFARKHDQKIAYLNDHMAEDEDNLQLVALVVTEYRHHCKRIESLFTETSVVPRHKFLVQALVALHDLVREIDVTVLHAGSKVQDFMRKARAKLRPQLGLFEQGLEGFRHAVSAPSNGFFDVYSESTRRLYAPALSRATRGSEVHGWRRTYISLSTGVGPGRHLRSVEEIRVDRLYEIWSFLELASALIAFGRQDLLQCTALKSNQAVPTFTGQGTGDVFFNYYGAKVPVDSPKKIFKDTHIEWMILQEESYQDSLVIDSKYREWNSEQNLKLLGYMNDFAVDNGMVIYGKGQLGKSFVGADDNQRLVFRRFGSAGQRTFAAMILIPERDEMPRNVAVLRECVADFF